MIEQVGSIFIECKCGHFVTSSFSDVFIRDKNFDILKNEWSALGFYLESHPIESKKEEKIEKIEQQSENEKNSAEKIIYNTLSKIKEKTKNQRCL